MGDRIWWSDDVSLLGTAALPEFFDILGKRYSYAVLLERIGPTAFAVHLGLQGAVLRESDRPQIQTFLRKVAHAGVGLMGSARQVESDVRPAGGKGRVDWHNRVRIRFRGDTRLIFSVNERIPPGVVQTQADVDFTLGNAEQVNRAYYGLDQSPCIKGRWGNWGDDAWSFNPCGGIRGAERSGLFDPVAEPAMYQLANRLAEGWTLEPVWGEEDAEARRMDVELPVCEAGEKPVVAALAADYFNEGAGSLEHEGFDNLAPGWELPDDIVSLDYKETLGLGRCHASRAL